MSVSDFEQVWAQRFPNTSLPLSWEEQIRLNFTKHKQKLDKLRHDLREEEIYVEYLERLLQDFDKQKKSEETGDVISDDNSPINVDSGAILADETETFSANMCVTEISSELSKISPNCEDADNASHADPSAFVTVIAVNGRKPPNKPPKPPKLPAKPDFARSSSFHPPKREHRDSANSGASNERLERLSSTEEHFYDMVAPEEYPYLGSDSSNENTLSSNASRQDKGSESPSARNYVNIEYFIQKVKNNQNGHSSSEEEEEEEEEEGEEVAMPARGRNGSYASSSSLDSSTPAVKRKFLLENVERETEVSSESHMYKCILQNIVTSETNYVEWLNVLLNYMKALLGSINTSQPLVTECELRTIFFNIPELESLHSNFLNELKIQIEKPTIKVGECFKTLASKLELYGAFLNNYSTAVDTVKRRCDFDSKFNELVRNITQKNLSSQPVILEDILHKPVARVQKNALVLHDLLKNITKSHPDYGCLTEALQMTQAFLDQFNMIQTKQMFPATDRALRRLVKNSFIVESSDNHRKLRHLFLFNDVIACAKYKPSGKTEKYTFELKWFIPVDEIVLLPEKTASELQNTTSAIVSLKSQASNVRDQLLNEEKRLFEEKKKMSRGSDKFKKRLMELESQLVLASPNLPFIIKGTGPRHYIFFLSSEFERQQWIEAILTLKRATRPPGAPNSHGMLELQTWITACRTFLKTNMGSYLLRSGQDESLLVGDLQLQIVDLTGIDRICEIYLAFEVDSYGHFFQKAKTKCVPPIAANIFQWNEKFIIDLEGCENLRVLVYQMDGTLVGKCIQKLSRKWLRQDPIERKLPINYNDAELKLNLTFIPSEVSIRRIPSGKNGALFGEKIQNVCKRQKRNVPFIVTACIREVERRGMAEVGLYRVSGSSLELTKLKKSFETNSYEAEQLLKEVDIHSVTGVLKSYLRELPEALFTDKLYPELLKSFNQSNGNVTRRYELLRECYEQLPAENRATFDFILDHLMRVHKHEKENKMSMHNLATVFGPTLLRPALKNDKNKDTLTTGTVDVMAQAGILLCYFQNINNMKMNSNSHLC